MAATRSNYSISMVTQSGSDNSTSDFVARLERLERKLSDSDHPILKSSGLLYRRLLPMDSASYNIYPVRSREDKMKKPINDSLECEFCDLISSKVKKRAVRLAMSAERRRNGDSSPPEMRRAGDNDNKEFKSKQEIDALFLRPELLSAYTIEQQLNELLESIPGSNVSSEIIGKTLSLNDIVLLKFTLPKLLLREDNSIFVDEPPAKKIIFIVHGLNPQGMNKLPCLSEPEYFIEYIQYYMKHLDKFDIFLVPIANPDGYAYQRSYGMGDLSWHKNMSPQTACSGVNVDRNFDVEWDPTTNINSCSQHFPGTQPFSEVEGRAIRKIFHTFSQKIVAYINVHGGTDTVDTFKGDAVLYPKGYSDVSTDEDKYLDMKGEIIEMMKNASFKAISVQMDSMHNWYGKVLGTSVDYASTVYGIPYAMEFVMQLYPDNTTDDRLPRYDVLACKQIWRRVIDKVFENIYKSLQVQEESRKSFVSNISLDYKKML